MVRLKFTDEDGEFEFTTGSDLFTGPAAFPAIFAGSSGIQCVPQNELSKIYIFLNSTTSGVVNLNSPGGW